MNLSAEQARDLADRFLEMAEAVKEYRLTHRRKLSADKRRNLKNAELELRDHCSDLTTAAVGLTLDGVQSDLESLMNVTDEAQQAIEKVQHAKQVINIVAAAVNLGTAIATQNPAAIASAMNNLRTEIA
jgi:hypothetical protein